MSKSKDNELYQMIGEIKAKVDSISDMLQTQGKKIDRAEYDISNVKQVQSKHTVYAIVAMTIFNAMFVYFLKGM